MRPVHLQESAARPNPGDGRGYGVTAAVARIDLIGGVGQMGPPPLLQSGGRGPGIPRAVQASAGPAADRDSLLHHLLLRVRVVQRVCTTRLVSSPPVLRGEVPAANARVVRLEERQPDTTGAESNSAEFWV